MATSIKITALTDIGNSITPTSLVPVVNMVGTPTTEKANLQIVGNLILAGSGGANYVAANRATTAGTVTTAAQPNITSTGTLTTLIVTGNISAGNMSATLFTGALTGLASSATVAASANAVAGANVSGQVGNALVAGTVYTNAQPNITSVGTLTSLSVTGNISAGNMSATLFTGALTGLASSATVAASANAVAGANVSGQVGNALVAGTVYTNAQPNITSVGTLTSLSVTGNITAGNINGGNLITANYSSAVLITAAQPNITSTGTLTSLSVTGNANVGNLGTAGLIVATGNITGANLIAGSSGLGNVYAGNVIVNGQPTTYGVANSWTLASGVNTVSISIPLNGTYAIWVNGNTPNGIVTYTATAVITNTNVPVLGEQYAWYYAIGNALVLTSIPDQFVGTVGSISTVNTYAGNTANVFTFGITNNSGNTAVVNYGYTKL